MIDEIVPDDYYCIIDPTSTDIPSWLNCLEFKNDAQATCVDINKLDMSFSGKLKHEIMLVSEWRENYHDKLVAQINQLDDTHKWYWVMDNSSSVIVTLKSDQTYAIISGVKGEVIKFDSQLGTSQGVLILLDILEITYKELSSEE